MAISTINVGDKIRAALINQLIGGVNGIAFSGVVPAAATGAGVTVSPNGKITFSGSSSITVTGVFTGTYDNYRIAWNIPSQTANADLAMRFNAAGSDDTTGNYTYMRQFARGSDQTVNNQFVSAASQFLLTTGANATQTNDGFMDVYGPALTRYTAGLGQATVYYSSLPQMYQTQTSIRHTSTSSFDGFTLYPVSGSITGTLRIYGYNNLT